MSAAPPLAGVLGWPIAHSRSPQLHGHWLRRYGITGYYIPIALEPADFADGLRSLQRLGFRGVNVTIPHKEAALALADSVTEIAATVGAANTLTFRPDGTIDADNTDVYGFLANLRQSVPAWSAATGPALVLGAGGAARGVIAGLLAEGARKIHVANRTAARADALAAHFGDRVVPVGWEDAARAASGAALVVNTTSLGMEGDADVPFDVAVLSDRAIVADIVYGAEPTVLIRAARARGLVGVDGVGMLLHQAVPGFERWFGHPPEVDQALRDAVLGR